MKRLCSALVFGILAAALAFAGQPPAPRSLDLTAPDGTRLKATYYAAAKAGPGVLLLHQCNAERGSWDGLARQLATSGIHVLTLDYRGYGESGGERYQDDPQKQQKIVNEKWPGDVDTAFAWLLAQPGVDRGQIGAGGASCGVNQSVQLSRRHPEVKSLVLLSGPANRIGRQYLRNTPGLPLFASAADDDGDTADYMHWLMGHSRNASNRFIRYQAGGHGTEMFAPHPDLPKQIVQWFDDSLRHPAKYSVADPAVAATAETRFWETLEQPGGPARAAQMLAQARQRDPKALSFPEGVMNLLGYERLAAAETEDAIQIFQMNVSAYPASANVYDSLADAYLAAGRKDLARQNAEKALEVLKTDTSAPAQFLELVKQSAEQKLQQLAATTQ